MNEYGDKPILEYEQYILYHLYMLSYINLTLLDY